MNYKKLTDTLDKKLLDFNLKFLGVFLGILVKPLAMCTEPFFRKNFGQRYFTENTLCLSGFIWAFALFFERNFGGGEDSPAQRFLHRDNLNLLAGWSSPQHVGLAVLIAYCVLAFKQIAISKRRQKAGEIWYSLGRGESLFGREDRFRDVLFAAFAVVVLWFLFPVLSVIFAASQATSYYLEAHQQASLYNRYLDAMDAKIEAEFLQRALDKGEPPVSTEGLYCPLPKSFQGQYRSRVARVVAGGPFVEGAAPALTGGGMPPRQPFPQTQYAAPPAPSFTTSPAPHNRRDRTGIKWPPAPWA